MASLGGGAWAQESSPPRETRCWLGSVTFSSGAAVNTGAGVSICEADQGWQQTDTDVEAAGCLLEGELSGVGAVVGISNNDRMWLRCESDGRWSTVEADEPAEG
jgi:hypothetical protein